MKIRAIHARREELPLKKPYTIAYKTITATDLIFLDVVLENGLVGYGAANPFPEVVGETGEMTLANLESDFVQAFKGTDIRAFQQLIYQTASRFPAMPGTLAALDIALHDAFAKYLGISVLDYYGRKIEALPTSITIGIKGIDEMIAEAKEYQAWGFRVLKIKTGQRAEEDIERVLKLDEVFGKNMIIRVDANQGYSLTELRTFMQATAGRVEIIEQPLKAGEETELLQIESGQREILVADESLLNAGDAFALSHPPAPFGVYNIKLMKCGGVLQAKEIASIANRAGIQLFWGCNDESIISITAALHAAYSCANTKYLDLDGSFDLTRDVVNGGFELRDGFLYPLDKPGFGFEKIR